MGTPAVRLDSPTEDERALARVRILMVDDRPDNLFATRAVLEDLGEDLVATTSAVEAVDHLLRQDFCLILLDVMMPGMDGFAVCETLRGNPATAAIPVLMLTGLCSHISQLVAFDAGATDYLIKPFVPEELISKVENLLCRAERLQAYHKNPIQNSSQPRKKSSPVLSGDK